MKNRKGLYTVAIAAAAVQIGGGLANVAHAQTAVSVGVNASSPITYAGGASIATMPATGLGLGTSVYANQWGNPALASEIKASGVQMLRYPGGSYSDLYNWDTGTGNDGIYVASSSNFANFSNVLTESATQGMVTVNYGSNTTNTIGGQPQEAAAWVAYANASANIYGTASDVTLGDDAAGTNWYTAGYWAKLRSSTPSQYQTWATAAGDYNPALAFLAVNHAASENVNYWEIGNEIGGNGYFGPQWEYDLHAPYSGGDTSSNVGRLGNPLLSPTAYAENLNQFAVLMKAVDPNIKIGAGFDASANNVNDAAILQTAGSNIDFGIIHWYPTGSLPNVVSKGSGSLPTEVANLRASVAANTSKGANGIEIDVTEFGYGTPSPTIENALFAADAYATGFENGVKNMDFQEMSASQYLGDSNPLNPSSVFYAIQMVSKFASTGDTFIKSTSNTSSLRVHAVEKAGGGEDLMFINDSTTASDNITISLAGDPFLSNTATLSMFGAANLESDGVTYSAPTSQLLSSIGSTFTVSIPLETIEVVDIPAVPEPASAAIIALATIGLVNRRSRRTQS